jgi:hypothetical protein
VKLIVLNVGCIHALYKYVCMILSAYFSVKKVVGLERGPLSLVSTTEKLLDRKVAAPF